VPISLSSYSTPVHTAACPCSASAKRIPGPQMSSRPASFACLKQPAPHSRNWLQSLLLRPPQEALVNSRPQRGHLLSLPSCHYCCYLMGLFLV
jgi:hypothetical protein